MNRHSPKGNSRKVGQRLLGLISSGLRTAAPFLVVLFVFNLVVSITDSWLKGPSRWLLSHVFPHEVFIGPLHGGNFPGASLGLFIVIMVVVGLLASTNFGKKLFTLFDEAFARMPLVRGIHSTVRRFTNTVAREGSHAFKMWVVIDDDGHGKLAVCVFTGETRVNGELHVCVMQPSPPNLMGGGIRLIPHGRVFVPNPIMETDDGGRWQLSFGTMLEHLETVPFLVWKSRQEQESS